MIFSEDPLAAALIAAGVELVGFVPTFPDDGEGPRDSLRRARPRLILVDCDHSTACVASFFGPAVMTGARVLIVGSRRATRNATALAKQFNLHAIMLPTDVPKLGDVLRAELEGAGT